MEELENKYIELLLKRCINFNKSKSLLISYDKVNKKFIEKVVIEARKLGVTDIYTDEEDYKLTYNKLKNQTKEQIINDPYFDKSIWDEYAKKDASFLMFDTEFPNVFNDIDKEKLVVSKNKMRETRKLFREKETSYQISWCIAALPNEIWAKSLFPNDDNAYEKLFKVICEMCMVDKENPIESWNNYIEQVKKQTNKLNDLQITKLTYKNKLGTNLTVSLPKNIKWLSAADDGDDNMLVNMPSYEIFSSPDYRYTEGIVYSSKPLMYGGGKIDKFYLEFKEGKVVNYDAKEGKEILKGIIESDNKSSYLGEIALVNNNSPISNTGLVFGTTLFDENASCHLALGDGFPDCIENGLKMNRDELLELGINHSENHVDFMIGTPDLEIQAETENGPKLIFKNGNFVI